MLGKQTNARLPQIIVLFAAALILLFSAEGAMAQSKTKGKTKVAGKTHSVRIRGSAFMPGAMTINVGDSVVWSNKDIIPHTATGKGFDSGNLDVGASWKFVFKKKGTYSYICNYHPTMRGTIIVK